MNFEKEQFRRKLKKEGGIPPDPKEHWNDPVDVFDPQPVRDEMAQVLKEAPKDERGAVLEDMRKMPEYHRAESRKMRERADTEEIVTKNGFDTVYIKKKVLYHGSPVQGITEFKIADNSLYGKGVYLTSEARDAMGYVNHRMAEYKAEGKEFHPILYRVVIENMRMLDLRSQSLEHRLRLSEGFREYVYTKLRNKEMLLDGEKEHNLAVVRIAEAYNPKGEVKLPEVPPIEQALSVIRYSSGLQVFTNYLVSLGYDGLVNYETEGDKVGMHDAYVIFDPKKVEIQREQEIEAYSD